MAHPSGLYFTMREDGETPSTVGRFARLSAIQGGMRQAFRKPFSTAASSLYSRTPSLVINTRVNPGNTPPVDFGDFFDDNEQAHNVRPDSPFSSRLNLADHSQPFGQHYSPAPPPADWLGARPVSPLEPEPAVLSHASSHATLTNQTTTSSSGRTRTTDSARRDRRKRKKRSHRRHQQDGAWVRSHRAGTTVSRSSSRRSALHREHKRGQNIYITTVVGALFLLATAVTYTAIALSVAALGKEIHILFIVTLAATFIFLCHSLFRLRRARQRIAARRARVKARSENFTPSAPIRVHMVHDEEAAIETPEHDDSPVEEKVPQVKMPPPAYGLWRSSVRVKPELLFWQKVDVPGEKEAALPKSAGGPRPPSYNSDGPQPRNVAQVPLERPPTEMHPAYRVV